MLYKEIEKWHETFKGNILDLLEDVDMYHPLIQEVYDKRFKTEFANVVYSVEEYYKIFEDGDEFNELKSGKYLDNVVDENLEGLRKVILDFKKYLIWTEGGLKNETCNNI